MTFLLLYYQTEEMLTCQERVLCVSVCVRVCLSLSEISQ